MKKPQTKFFNNIYSFFKNRPFVILGISLCCIFVVLIAVNKELPVTSEKKDIILIRESGLIQYKPSQKDDSHYSSVEADETKISSDTTIKTTNAFAHILFPDSSIMSLDPNSIVTIDYSTDVKTIIKQIAGNSWHRVKQITDPVNGGYEVHTPNAVAAVRGTEFKVESILTDDSSIIESKYLLVEGEIIITDPLTEENVKLLPGKMVTLTTPITELVANPSELAEQQGLTSDSSLDSKPNPETSSLVVEDIPAEIFETEDFKRNQTITEELISIDNQSRESKITNLKGISDNLKIQLINKIIARNPQDKNVDGNGYETVEQNNNSKNNLLSDLIATTLNTRIERREKAEQNLRDGLLAYTPIEPVNSIESTRSVVVRDESTPPAVETDRLPSNTNPNPATSPDTILPPDTTNPPIESETPSLNQIQPIDQINTLVLNRINIYNQVRLLQLRRQILEQVTPRLYSQRDININRISEIDSNLAILEPLYRGINIIPDQTIIDNVNSLNAEKRNLDFQNIRITQGLVLYDAEKISIETQLAGLDSRSHEIEIEFNNLIEVTTLTDEERSSLLNQNQSANFDVNDRSLNVNEMDVEEEFQQAIRID